MEVIVVAAGLAAPDLKHSTSSMALRNSAPRQWRQSRSSATKINSFQKLPSVVLCRGYQLWYKQNCMSKFLPSSRTRIFWVASWKMRSAQGGSEQNIEKENSLKIQETKKTTGRNSFKIFEERRQDGTHLRSMKQRQRQVGTHLRSTKQRQRQDGTHLRSTKQRRRQVRTQLRSMKQRRRQVGSLLRSMKERRRQVRTNLRSMKQRRLQDGTHLRSMKQRRRQVGTHLRSRKQRRQAGRNYSVGLNSQTNITSQLSL